MIDQVTLIVSENGNEFPGSFQPCGTISNNAFEHWQEKSIKYEMKQAS